jgi:uncharacterized membrane protein YecN with MAPEG domain
MLPISGLYAALLTIVVITLALRVIRQRFVHRIGLGDGGQESLMRAMRVHGNAIETIPLSLLLLIILEVNQASGTSLHIFGSLLLIGRVLHAWGMSRKSSHSFGRFWGTLTTLLVQMAMVAANLWLYWTTVT